MYLIGINGLKNWIALYHANSIPTAQMPSGCGYKQSWALSVFFNFLNNKKLFCCINNYINKLITYFCTSPI